MGTSQSSKGSPGGTPMVPPWTPAPPPTYPPPPEETQPPAEDGHRPLPDASAPAAPNPIAPSRRFYGPKLNLGAFASSGDTSKMRRGIGQYSRSSYNGGRTAARRLSSASSTAQALYNSLGNVATGVAAYPGSNLDPALLRGSSAEEIMDAVVDAVRPIDGSLDSEASRVSIRDALSDLLDIYPDADILSLSEDEKVYAVEHYVASEIFHRIDLDVGQHIRNRAPNYIQALDRLQEIKEYIQSSVALSFSKFRNAGNELRNSHIESLVQSVLEETFNIFEEYI